MADFQSVISVWMSNAREKGFSARCAFETDTVSIAEVTSTLWWTLLPDLA